MQLNEQTMTYSLSHFARQSRLANGRQLLSYLTANVPESDQEMFWLLAMDSQRHPITRQRLAHGPLAAVQVSVQKVFLSLALTDAKAFACLRTQPSGTPQPTLADGHLVYRLREMAMLCHIEFVDYLIAPLDGSRFHSWREHDRRAA